MEWTKAGFDRWNKNKKKKKKTEEREEKLWPKDFHSMALRSRDL